MRLSTHVKEIKSDLNEQHGHLERRINSALAEVGAYVQSLHSEIA